MTAWRIPLTSLDGNAVTGILEGSEMDLRGILDQHAMNVSATASGGGSPTFKFQLQGICGSNGWMVLAELDETDVPLGTTVQIVVHDQPSQRVKAVCIVTSGAINPRAVITSKG